MAHLVSFRTAKFDVRAEDPNPINPIFGQSVLRWLRAELARAHYTVTEPSTEDWGWYVDVEAAGANYLVGASGDAENSTSEIEWIVQVHKHRSLTDKLFGRKYDGSGRSSRDADRAHRACGSADFRGVR